jgi:hypothetical protein
MATAYQNGCMNKKDIYTNHSIRATGATILGRNCSINVFHQKKNKFAELFWCL